MIISLQWNIVGGSLSCLLVLKYSTPLVISNKFLFIMLKFTEQLLIATFPLKHIHFPWHYWVRCKIIINFNINLLYIKNLFLHIQNIQTYSSIFSIFKHVFAIHKNLRKIVREYEDILNQL